MNHPDQVSQRHENLMQEMQDTLSSLGGCTEAHAPFYFGIIVGVVWAMREAGISHGVVAFLARDAYHQIHEFWPGLQEQFGSPLTVIYPAPTQGSTS